MTNILKTYKHAGSLAIVCCSAALLTACASPPTADVAASNAAVTEATQANAAKAAPLEMTSAQDKLAQANQAMESHNYTQAKELAAEAQADAKLALAKANSSKAQQAADALQDDIRVLRQELNRKSESSAETTVVQ